jgi:hypothetical protein
MFSTLLHTIENVGVTCGYMPKCHMNTTRKTIVRKPPQMNLHLVWRLNLPYCPPILLITNRIGCHPFSHLLRGEEAG